jgi:hypothetical protein
MKKLLAAVALASGLAVAAPATAGAAPKSGFPVTVECPSGTYEGLVAPGEGEWVPMIVTRGPARVLHPVGFESFEGTLRDELGNIVEQFSDDEASYRQNAFRHPHGYERCTFSAVFVGPVDDIPEGYTGEISGVVLMRAAPPRR